MHLNKMFRLSVLLVTALLLHFPCHYAARLLSAPTTTPPTTKGRAVLGIKTPPPRAAPNNFRGHIGIWTPPPDLPSGGALCQIWGQDCPDGSKCIPEDLTSKPRCRKIKDNPDQVGDVCSTLQNNDGDSCDIDGMCIGGVCRPLCFGTPANPKCPFIDQTCHFYPKGAIVCEERCDPLLNGVCGNGRYCSIDSAAAPNTDQVFTCMFKPDTPLGTEGDSCVYTSHCRQGLACVGKNSLKSGFCNNNNALSCCTRLAEDVKDCQSGDQLAQYYSDPPPGLEHVGVCVFAVF